MERLRENSAEKARAASCGACLYLYALADKFIVTYAAGVISATMYLKQLHHHQGPL